MIGDEDDPFALPSKPAPKKRGRPPKLRIVTPAIDPFEDDPFALPGNLMPTPNPTPVENLKPSPHGVDEDDPFALPPPPLKEKFAPKRQPRRCSLDDPFALGISLPAVIIERDIFGSLRVVVLRIEGEFGRREFIGTKYDKDRREAARYFAGQAALERDCVLIDEIQPDALTEAMRATITATIAALAGKATG